MHIWLYTKRIEINRNIVQVQQSLEEVLEQDDDLAAMHLTKRTSAELGAKEVEIFDHDDLEVLLESYSKQAEELVNECNTMEVRLSLPMERSGTQIMLI